MLGFSVLGRRQGVARKRFTAEQIIIKLREAEVGLAQGQTVAPGVQTGVTSRNGKSCAKEICGPQVVKNK